MPWSDWQFWVVSIAALWAGYVIFRQIIPGAAKDSSACSTCAVGAAATATPDQRRHSSELPVVSSRN